MPPRRSGSRSRPRCRSARTPRREDFEAALDVAIDNPNVDAVVAVFIPPLNTTGEEVANVLATVGEQSDKPIVSTFLGSEGIPELLRVPDLEGVAGRGLGPVVPGAGDRGAGAWRGSSTTRTGSTGRPARHRGSRTSTPARRGCW